MKTYKIEEIVKMIETSEIMIPIQEFFVEESNERRHITKKEYGHVLLKYLVKELKEKYS